MCDEDVAVIATCEHALYVSQVFGAELKPCFPFFLFVPPVSLPHRQFYSLCRVSFTAMEICVFTDNSHAWSWYVPTIDFTSQHLWERDCLKPLIKMHFVIQIWTLFCVHIVNIWGWATAWEECILCHKWVFLCESAIPNNQSDFGFLALKNFQPFESQLYLKCKIFFLKSSIILIKSKSFPMRKLIPHEEHSSNSKEHFLQEADGSQHSQSIMFESEAGQHIRYILYSPLLG